LPPLSVGGAQGARPWLRFHIPLFEPDVRYLRIRLSDKPSCLRPRKVARARRQMHQPQYLIEILVGEARRPRARHFVFLAQPSTQPLSSVSVEQSAPVGPGAAVLDGCHQTHPEFAALMCVPGQAAWLPGEASSLAFIAPHQGLLDVRVVGARAVLHLQHSFCLRSDQCVASTG